MNVAILARYPRVDTAQWKQDLAARIVDGGSRLTVVYTRSSLREQLRAGLGEFGLGVVSRYRRARATPETGEDARTLSSWAAEHGIEVLRFGSVADPELSVTLAKQRIDVLVLAGADIAPAQVLAKPQIGALNAHFGLLPRYRGMNVAEWSVFHDDPVGVSVHFVDPGIDTGDIVSMRPVRVDMGDTLDTIRQKQRAEAVALLSDAIVAVETGRINRTPQLLDAGRQFYRMHPALRAYVEAKLTSGRYAWLGRGAEAARLEDA